MKHNKKLGQILIEYGIITSEQCTKALHYQKEHNLLIGEALVRLGYIENEDIIIALSEQEYGSSLKGTIHALCASIFHKKS